jgi:hypothetical protein
MQWLPYRSANKQDDHQQQKCDFENHAILFLHCPRFPALGILASISIAESSNEQT